MDVQGKGELYKIFSASLERFYKDQNQNLIVNRETIKRRSLQSLCEFLAHDLEVRWEKNQNEIKSAAQKNQFLKSNSGINFNFCTGAVQVSLTQTTVILWLKFISIWFYSLLALLTFWGKKFSSSELNLVCILGLAPEWVGKNEEQSKIFEYLSDSNNNIFEEPNFYFIENYELKKEIHFGNVVICRFPEISLIKNVKLNFKQRLSLLISHLADFFKIHFQIFKFPLFVTFGRELGYGAVFSRLDKWGMISGAVLTTTHLSKQPLWVQMGKNLQVHFLHYAQVPTEHVYISDKNHKLSRVYFPLKFAMPMMHHVWTNNDKQKLIADYGISNIRISGVPSFISGGSKLKKSKINSYRIVIFDVTPLNPNSPEFNNLAFYYGSTSVISRMIREIYAVKREVEEELGIKIKLLLKSKREFNPKRDDIRYLQLLNKIKFQDDTFKIERKHINETEAVK